MKPKITKPGLLNEININLAADSISSKAEGSLPTTTKINFTDLYLQDSLNEPSTSRFKGKVIHSDIEPFRNIAFQITIRSYKGFFKNYALCISYKNLNSSVTEKFYPIDQTLEVVSSLPLGDISDLTQVCISVRSQDGTALKISSNVSDLNPSNELKVDLTALSKVNLFVNDELSNENGAQFPIGWVSYNTQNIFY